MQYASSQTGAERWDIFSDWTTPMIHDPSSGVNHRTFIRQLRPANAPHLVAGVLYHDPMLGVVLHSIRSSGIHNNSSAIQFDANVLDEAENRGCTVVEVRTGGTVYSATLATIRQRGRYVNTRFGLQLSLALRWWSTEGVTVAAVQVAEQPTHERQLNLFEVSA